MIQQGDIYWEEGGEPSGSEPGYLHPVVVIQNNVFNHSRIGTVIACVLTSNLKAAVRPGNVLLHVGEGNLPKQSVVNVSQIITLDKQSLGEYIGTLSPRRVRDILASILLLLEPRELDESEDDQE